MTNRTAADVASEVGVTADTLRRWVRGGVVPMRDNRWTPAAVAHARIVARLRRRGYPLDALRKASQSGRLAFGYMEDMFPSPSEDGFYTLDDVALETGLEEDMIRRVWGLIGFPADELDAIGEDDLQLLRYIAAVIDAGLPTVAFLQLVRVYGQAMRAVADAEVRLFHLYVHEPLIRDGVPGLEMAEEMEGLARDLLPLASPIMDHLHQRYLAHFVEQDVVGHLEAEEELDLGRLRVAIAFADLSGYTRLTEEAGEEHALDTVERFVQSVEDTLPDEARVVKSLGDAVMVVGTDSASLTEWAVGFQELQAERPLPRIGIHVGSVLYRDGDYFGRAVNLASRVGARAAGHEVLVTREVVDAGSPHLSFQRIGEVRLKGFADATELYLARPKEP